MKTPMKRARDRQIAWFARIGWRWLRPPIFDKRPKFVRRQAARFAFQKHVPFRQRQQRSIAPFLWNRIMADI